MEYLTLTNISTILNVHKMTVYRWVKMGKLKAVQLGKLYRVEKKDLDEFINQYKK